MENKETFNYTYSAKQQEEINEIRKKYYTQEEDKMELVRRMDASVNKKACRIAIIVGIIGALILGFGMSLVMSELPSMLGIGKNPALVIGIITGIIGIVPVCLAYPIYIRTMKKERNRIAPEILRLTDELMK